MENLVTLPPLEKCAKLIEEIGSFKTQFDVFRFMKRVTEAFGSRFFMVMTLPARTTLTISGSSVITNWPPELIAFYDREGLLTASPVIERLRNSTVPFHYDTSRINHGRKDGKNDQVVEAFNNHGMTRGAYFPVHDSLGQRGAIEAEYEIGGELGARGHPRGPDRDPMHRDRREQVFAAGRIAADEHQRLAAAHGLGRPGQRRLDVAHPFLRE